MTESEKMSGMQLSRDAAGGKPLEGASDMAFKVADLADVLYGGEITVLGIGNIILGDEGFGVRVAEYLDAHYDFPRGVQILDGGTLGIELTQYLTGTKKLLIIDSIIFPLIHLKIPDCSSNLPTKLVNTNKNTAPTKSAKKPNRNTFRITFLYF